MNKKGSISCKNIKFRYFQNSKREIVKNFSFCFNGGKKYLITGFSGCGKSTLAYILAGLYPENKGVLESGEILIEGKNINEFSFPERAKKVAIMFQNVDTQFCMGTVKEEFIFVLENINYLVEKIDEKIDESLEKIGILHLKERELHTLSGGEKQKVVLSIIYMLSSDIIILDEPFANIDYEAAQEIQKILFELNRDKGTTLLIIDHRISLWKNYDCELLELEEGCKIVEKSNLLELEDRIILKKECVKGEKTNLVEVSNLELCQGNTILGKNLNFTVKKGEITGIIGKSGTGKSTLLKVLSGLLEYKRGSIKFEGKEFRNLKHQEILENIGLVFQNPQNQFVSYKVIDEILFTMKGLEENSQELAEKMLRDFDLEIFKDSSPYSLSQGQQRKLAVLSMLGKKQKLLMCDEPTYGQDNRTSRELMEYLRKKAEEGITIILVSHDINLIYEYSDVIYKFKNKEMIKIEDS